MGLTNIVNDFQEKIIKKVGFQWQNIKIGELGGMSMKPMINISAKKYYIEEKKVLEHVSIDRSGIYDALNLDLCFPLPKELINRFHLVTDFGTIEHVKDQYQVFKNAHDMCVKNGVIVHTLPSVNYWKHHCFYFYPMEFFIELGKLCSYKILALEVKNPYSIPLPKRKLVFIAFMKQNNNNFISKEIFSKLKIFGVDELSSGFNFCLERVFWHLWELRQYIMNFGKKYLKKIYQFILNILNKIKK